MKLVKITDEHYVIVDENAEIKEGDWYVGLHNKVIKATDGKHYAAEAIRFSGKPVYKITHSTQPLYKNDFWAIQELKLSEVKELIGEVNVRKAIAVGFDWCHQKLIPQDWMINNYIQHLKQTTQWDVEFDLQGKLKLI